VEELEDVRWVAGVRGIEGRGEEGGDEEAVDCGGGGGGEVVGEGLEGLGEGRGGGGDGADGEEVYGCRGGEGEAFGEVVGVAEGLGTRGLWRSGDGGGGAICGRESCGG